jgi:hypothetical protein
MREEAIDVYIFHAHGVVPVDKQGVRCSGGALAPAGRDGAGQVEFDAGEC